MTMPPLSEKLFHQAKSGDKNAINLFIGQVYEFSKYCGEKYFSNVAGEIMPQDIAQEVSMNTYKKLLESRLNNENLKGYISRATSNTYYNHITKLKRRGTHVEITDYIELGEENIESNIAINEVINILENVSLTRANVAIEYIIDAEETKDLAKKYGMVEKTVRTTVHRFRNKVKKLHKEEIYELLR